MKQQLFYLHKFFHNSADEESRNNKKMLLVTCKMGRLEAAIKQVKYF